jgi:hypothetical protein
MVDNHHYTANRLTRQASGVHWPSLKEALFVTSSVSLKSVVQELAPAFNMTPAALYERQRVLVRAGWLSGKEGKGPGSGVHATPHSVSLLLISALATDSLSEVQVEVGRLVTLRIKEELQREASGETVSVAGPWTVFAKERRFDRALESLLKSPTSTGNTSCIIASRGEDHARIDFREEEDGSSRSFVFGGRSSRKSPGLLKIEASLGPYPLIHIANLIPDVCMEWWQEYPSEEMGFLF